MFNMDTLESVTPVPETVFTNRGRRAINEYKRKFAKMWKKNPPTNPERFKPNLETGYLRRKLKVVLIIV